MRTFRTKIATIALTAGLVFLTAAGAFAGRLSLGDSGEPVKDLQQRLKEKGHYSGDIDGKFGQKTENAVKAFQKAKGLKTDGKVGDKTWALLTSDKAPNPTLRLNDKGDAVKKLQTALNAKENLNLKVDGKFGSGTEKAVKKFQSKNNITADGVVGGSTWNALGNP